MEFPYAFKWALSATVENLEKQVAALQLAAEEQLQERVDLLEAITILQKDSTKNNAKIKVLEDKEKCNNLLSQTAYQKHVNVYRLK
mgnify:CR=1 FL=1